MFVCNVDCFSFRVIKCRHFIISKRLLECYEFSFCKNEILLYAVDKMYFGLRVCRKYCRMSRCLFCSEEENVDTSSPMEVENFIYVI